MSGGGESEQQPRNCCSGVTHVVSSAMGGKFLPPLATEESTSSKAKTRMVPIKPARVKNNRVSLLIPNSYPTFR